jgi:hypothetical protein
MRLFGVSLATVLAAQKKSHPDLLIPHFIDLILSHLTFHCGLVMPFAFFFFFFFFAFFELSSSPPLAC